MARPVAPRQLRPPRFYKVPPPPSFSCDPEFHNLRLACALYQQEEDRKRGRDPNRPNPTCPELDKLIRDACHAAAVKEGMLQRAFRIASVADGTRVKIGAKIGSEILAALGRWLDDENGKETP